LIATLFWSYSQPAMTQTPQVVPDAQMRESETLTERLDRTGGVIKPPPVDGQIQITPPPQSSNMPVIKPGEAPNQQTAPNAGK
jgi:hypothetical protein